MRVIEGGEREAGVFAPVERPRLLERLSASANYPITLVIAPAGYGKSVVLRQYLRVVREPHVRFTLQSEHASLLSFLRGFAEALRDFAPHAIDALAGAYERMTPSPKRCADLARWLHAHLESFDGVIAIDDLHVADCDPDVAAFLCSLIERSKGRIRWIVASRSTRNLPIGTWLAYRDAELAIDEEDLRFTTEEARSAAGGLGIARRDDELNDLLALTEGWPAAMSFALRTSTRSSDLRNISALTREMIYRFLAEQVYSELDEDERALLEVAITLPVISVGVLERAGFDRALPTVERLRERTAFIYEDSAGIYQCHELFREFLRHQSALGGKHAQQQVHERAARALESGGDAEHAIASYVLAALPADVVRLLERDGFEMLERAQGDVVAQAIGSLDDATRRQNATILALQGALQATAGKFARAESLLRRALAKAGNNRDLFAITSLRLASLVANQGGEITNILHPVANDHEQNAEHRAEALSLVLAAQAMAGEADAVKTRVAEVERLLPEIENDLARARTLHHFGVANRHIGETDRATQALLQSRHLASELHLYSVESRVSAVLSNLALQVEDDVKRQLAYAELAANAATKAGDVFGLRTALLQILGAHMRLGDIAESIAVEQRISGIADDSARHYLALFRSMRLAWQGRFEEAHRLIAPCWARMHFDFDRVSCGAHLALFLALDGRRESSIRLVREVLRTASTVSMCGVFRSRSLALSKTLCGLAEFANGRFTYGERMLRAIPTEDAVARSAVEAVTIVGRADNPVRLAEQKNIAKKLTELAQLGHGDAARLLTAAHERLQSKDDRVHGKAPLTASEREVLGLLATGLAPKEIAAETGRSVNTVRVHIVNAVEKLECHGRTQAVKVARRLGLI